MGDRCSGTGGWRRGLEAAGGGGESAMATIMRVPTFWPACRLWTVVMDCNPYLGAAGERGDSGHKHRQSFLWAEVDILGGPGVMTADQSSGFGGDAGGLEQHCTAGGGRILLLGGVEMDGLWIWLRGRSSAVGHIDVDTQRPQDIHPNQDSGRFEADDYYEAGPSSSFAPLEVKVLGLPCDLEWFAVCTVDDSLERLQGTPLGAVLPPHRESHAGH